METDLVFRALDVINSVGRTLQIDDIKDSKEWFSFKRGWRLHHGAIGFLLEQLSVLGGLALLGHEMVRDEYPVTYNSPEEALEKLIEEVTEGG